jgi:methyltransferase (TIGR00027 family)
MLTVADTAFAIAVVRAIKSDLPAAERLFEDPYASIFAAAGVHAEEGTQRFLGLEFMREGVRLRTRFIDDVVRDALAAGTTQVVLLGAGFDARGLRMDEIAQHRASVYEVDLADQLERKRALLEAVGVRMPPTIAYVPCDFRASDDEAGLLASLEAHGFRTGAGALFVWEGVIAYIDDAAVDRALAFMVCAGGRGSRVVFEYAESRFEPVSAAEHARRAGYRTFDEVRFEDLWQGHLRGEPHDAARICRMGVAAL